MWHFIELVLYSIKIRKSLHERTSFNAIIASGGPYKKNYFDEVVTPIIEDYDRITVMFKDKTKEEDDVSNKELEGLLSDIAN